MEMFLSYHQIKKETSRYMINADKVKSFCNTVQYMYGIYISHDTKEALKFDEENSNDNWKKAIRLEQLIDYDRFIDEGLRQHMSNNYIKIRCHAIFAVKHDR